MFFYNTRHMTQPGTHNCVRSDASELTRVSLTDVDPRRMSALHDFRLRVEASVNDPVCLLMPADRNAAEIPADWGVKVTLAPWGLRESSALFTALAIPTRLFKYCVMVASVGAPLCTTCRAIRLATVARRNRPPSPATLSRVFLALSLRSSRCRPARSRSWSGSEESSICAMYGRARLGVVPTTPVRG